MGAEVEGREPCQQLFRSVVDIIIIVKYAVSRRMSNYLTLSLFGNFSVDLPYKGL